MWPATLLTLHFLQCSCTVCGRSQCLLSQPPDRLSSQRVDRRALLSRAENAASKRVGPRAFRDGGRGGGRFSTPPLASVPHENVLVACREENGPLSLATKEERVPFSLGPGFHLPLSYSQERKFRGWKEGSRFLTTAVIPLFARAASHPCYGKIAGGGGTRDLSFFSDDDGLGSVQAVFSLVRVPPPLSHFQRNIGGGGGGEVLSF